VSATSAKLCGVFDMGLLAWFVAKSEMFLLVPR
jgi:hypothetical protein